MIEISHQQARRLVRDGLDVTSAARISNEQWSALQDHLEACQACQAYSQERQRLHKALGRSFLQRWSTVSGPDSATPDQVALAHSRFQTRRRLFWQVGLSALALILLTSLFLARQMLFPELYFSGSGLPGEGLASPATATAPAPTPTPPQPGSFRGVLLAESAHSGDSEIYLINAGPAGFDLTNLTQSPAQDTAPVWSPDGEWIAFLSDRSGKRDVYVISVAGTRLTRLTFADDLDWRGPLTWSADGRWIAGLAERISQSRESYLYMVPLDGRQEMRSVAFTRAIAGSPQFSPGGPFLAFQSAHRSGLLYAYKYEEGFYFPINANEVQILGLRAYGPFEWMGDGARLLYQAEGPYLQDEAPQLLNEARSEVRLSFDINTPNAASIPFPSSWGGHTESGVNGYDSLSSVPGSLLAASVADSGQDGCPTLSLYPYNLPSQRPVEIAGLCIEGKITRSSWSTAAGQPDEVWLVVRGRRLGQVAGGLFALRLPTRLQPELRSPLSVPVEEIFLAELSLAADGRSAEPQVRPLGASLAIQPIAPPPAPPTAPTAEALVPEDLPADAAGPVVAAVVSGRDHMAMFSLSPSGVELARYFSTGAQVACPVLSPDGSRLAFTSTIPNSGRMANEIMVAGSTGGQIRQLTDLDFPGSLPADPNLPLPRFDCPVWSPDGLRLAAIYRTPQAIFLAVVAADGSEKANYLQLEPLVQYIDWPADNLKDGLIYVLNSSYFNRPPRIDTIDLNSSENISAFEVRGAAVEETLLEFPGYDSVAAFAVSPDGVRSAVLLVDYSSDGRRLLSRTVLNVGEIRGNQVAFELGPTDLNQVHPRSLAWLNGGRVGLLQSLPLTGRDKAELRIYDPREPELISVARLPDLITSAAWAKDGRWVYLGSESGLYVLNVPLAIAGQAVPARIFPQWVSEVDTR